MDKILEHNSGVTWLHITNISELKQYEHYLNSCINDTDDSLFSSFQWLKHWTNVFWQNNYTLHLFIALDNEECVLFAPFYIQSDKTFPFFKKLTLLGQGEPEICEISSEYQDIFISPNYNHLIEPLWKKISTLTFDQAYFNALLKHANLLTLFSFNQESIIKNVGTRYSFLSKGELSPVLSKNNRSKLKKCDNKLKGLGAEFTWVSEDNYEKYWLLMEKYHQKRWCKLEKKGAFAHNSFSEFHYDYRKLNPKNIKMSAVEINNVPVAIHYYLVAGKTLYFYQSGWDEDNYAKISPGFALHVWSMTHSNYSLYDFMMGDSNQSYKSSLGCNQTHEMYSIMLDKCKHKLTLDKWIKKCVKAVRLLFNFTK